MNRWMTVVAVVVILGVGIGLTAARAEKGPAEKPGMESGAKCPVMDEPVDVSVSVATDDGPVFFCCPDCIKKYQEKPDKYAEKVTAQRKAMASLPKVQVACPLTGKPVDSKMFTEKDGKKVFFCCPNCKSKYEAEPAKYAGALAGSYTYQTKCPVTEKEINPLTFVELANGRKIYCCSKECGEKLLKEPAKYLPNLEKQSIHLKPEEVKVKE
ncbi:MAG: hypothetical protein V2A79_02425 [Planctomycetota bacterium]